MDIIQEAKSKLLHPKISSANSQLEKFKTRLNSLTDYSSADYRNIIKEISKYEKILTLSNLINRSIDEITYALEIKDPELLDLAENQIKEEKERLEKNLVEIGSYTQFDLKNDDKEAIFEIRPGVGGIEASLFAEELFNAYTAFLSGAKMAYEILSITYNQEGGINEAIFSVNESGSFGEFRFEGGVHRVQRIPKTEAMGRIHTSTVSVVIIPKFEASEIKIDTKDIKIDVYRSSGPGGQSVNTTDSAVRITHIPTGIIVTCQNGKSQHKNKDTALSVLYSKLQEIEDEKRSKEQKNLRMASVLTSDRSAKIRTYNFPQSRVTDHRVNVSWFNINEIMQGNLKEVIQTCSTKIREELETFENQ